MENILKGLKEEYVGKEFKLLELDNSMQTITEENSWYFNSIFEGEVMESLDSGTFIFATKMNDDDEAEDYLYVDFKIIKLEKKFEDDESDYDFSNCIVKVTNIYV